MSTFWKNNKVLILSVLASIAVSLQQIATGNPDIKVIAYAVIMAALGAIVSFEKTAQGTTASIIGIVGTTLGSIVPSLFEGTPVGWPQLIGSLLVAILAIINPGQTPAPAPMGISLVSGNKGNGFNNIGSLIVCFFMIALNLFVFFFFSTELSLTVRIIGLAITAIAGFMIAKMESPYISNGKFWLLFIITVVATFGEMLLAMNYRDLHNI
jgi:hypothetical protein